MNVETSSFSPPSANFRRISVGYNITMKKPYFITQIKNMDSSEMAKNYSQILFILTV